MSIPVVDQSASQRTHWTSRDLELLPKNGVRYEIIDGELFMSKSPLGIISAPAAISIRS